MYFAAASFRVLKPCFRGSLHIACIKPTGSDGCLLRSRQILTQLVPAVQVTVAYIGNAVDLADNLAHMYEGSPVKRCDTIPGVPLIRAFVASCRNQGSGMSDIVDWPG